MAKNNMAIALSVIFCLSPVALTIHLAIKQAESNAYKKRLGYIYGGLWAIAFLGYGWLFFSSK
ncbi:hypothetical protein IQ255_26705 [Pleurocapsales cyanobacterium LEGE 10410]|nr:hypothetical protein [Pleurocapsales cyanobacterium LEGE 10410]